MVVYANRSNEKKFFTALVSQYSINLIGFIDPTSDGKFRRKEKV